ncbi:unnamed protein product [Camellia sinensis]
MKVSSMADSEGSSIAGGSFSQLLFADDDVGLDTDGCYNYTSSFSTENPPKMLCFGDYNRIGSDVGVSETTTRTAQKSRLTCSDSSSASSTTSTSTTTLSKANKRRNGLGNQSIQSFIAGIRAPAGSQRNCKKTKSENSTVTGHGKVKREKLGERITALQQLVSPYGKTDTASVLHEAMGYIRFLHDQVHVLCSPYLERLSSSSLLLHRPPPVEGENGEGNSRKDLRSRGLCLVPIECTEHIANNNGADFWSPAMGNNVSPKH